MIECDKQNCKQRYIGETERTLNERFTEHKGYVKNKHLNQATGSHFNEPGHGLENMKVIIIEKSKQTNEPFRKEREKFFIQKFNTFKSGLNKKP